VSERDRKEESARDLVQHPGWADVIADAKKTAKAARGALLHTNYETAEAQGLAAQGARSTINAIYIFLKLVYERANEKIPADVAALIE
jgi:hypothetical protein